MRIEADIPCIGDREMEIIADENSAQINIIDDGSHNVHVRILSTGILYCFDESDKEPFVKINLLKKEVVKE